VRTPCEPLMPALIRDYVISMKMKTLQIGIDYVSSVYPAEVMIILFLDRHACYKITLATPTLGGKDNVLLHNILYYFIPKPI